MIVTDKYGRKRSVRTHEEEKKEMSRLVKSLNEAEVELFQSILSTQLEDGYEILREHRYHTIPVSIEQFLSDPYYLGESCATLWPELKNDIIAAFESPYREAVFTGGIGVGKTFVATIIICRILYELSCLVNPQKTFGLSSGTEIVIPLISKNLILAREIMKSAVDDKLKESPYFMEKFPPDFKREHTMLPNNIRVTVGSYGSERVLGANVICAFCDETNFPPKTKRQQINTGFGQKLSAAHFDIVEKVYLSLQRRIKSRFQKVGSDFPGMVILASSAATVDSFTERKLRSAKTDSGVFVRDHAPWSARPRSDFSGEWFYVLCSASSLKARILSDEEANSLDDQYLEDNDAWVIEVPVEYRDDFEGNMEDALRDVAGVSTQAISAFLQRVDSIDDCVTGKPHPFTKDEWVAGGPGRFKWDELCRKFERELPDGYKEDAYAPKVNPKAYRWVHIDTSISGDSSGFCAGHVDRWVEVVRRDGEGNRYADIAPYYVIDLMLRINPPPAEQIYMPDLRRLVYEMMDHGFVIMGFSTDSYQYVEMHQQVKRRGIHTELISMDRTTEPYDELKAAIYENRIEFYGYEPFIEELKALEYDRVSGKIDHPQAGSKDISDAVAGVIYGLMSRSDKLPLDAMAGTQRKMVHKDNWVSEKIPAAQVDFDEVRSMKEEDGDDDVEFMPIFFGED